MKRLFIFITVVSILTITKSVFAQPIPPSFLSQSPQSVPLGGLGILVGAGGLYALKKLRDRK